MEGVEERQAVEAEVENAKSVEVRRQDFFKPVAREYEADIRVSERSIKFVKSREGVEGFTTLFQDRFKKIRRLFGPAYRGIEITSSSVRKEHFHGEELVLVGMVYEKRESKKGHVLLYLDDLEGRVVALISKDNEVLKERAARIANDDVIRVYGRVASNGELFIVDDFEWPDIRERVEQPTVEKEVAALYISDTHLGSRFTIEKYFYRLIKWLKEPAEKKEIAGRIKYVIIGGDLVDGIGIYPGQEKELTITDIYKQYERFDHFLNELPDYIEVVVIPGNHDAVRRGEPMEPMEKGLFTRDIHSLPNPSFVTIEGYKHLLYHGTSFDAVKSSIPGLDNIHIEQTLKEILVRRHLSPVYGSNPIVPGEADYMVIDEIPHIFHTGHVHRNAQAKYKGIVLINSGTFQGMTPYQIKQGHVPTPGKVPIYDFKDKRFGILDLNTEV